MYDIIIIGGGPAGITSGIYASRARMETLLLEKMAVGGQALLTYRVENYPGFPDGIAGTELSSMMEKQAIKFGLKIATEDVKDIVYDEGSNNSIIINTSENKYETLSVIIATGVSQAKLNVPGEEEFIGRGVSFCATCDAPFYRDSEVVVVGGGDAAIEEAIYLTKFASKVTLIHRRDRLRAVKVLQGRAFANQKIKFVWDSVVTEVLGKGGVEGVMVKNLKTTKLSNLACSGIFIFVGHKPNTDFLIIKLDSKGYIVTDDNMKTSRKGIFACGDCRSKTLRQIITACGDGATAAFSAQQYVEELKGVAY